jgi:hypothetical protein
MQICSLDMSLYIWQVKTILPVGSLMDGMDAGLETDKGVEADSVASRFGAGMDTLKGKLQASTRNISPQINGIRLFIINHLEFKSASVGL